MSEGARATITLTAAQVSQVVQQASVQEELGRLLSEIEDREPIRDVVLPLMADDTLSRSTLRALLVLAAFDRFDEPREITEVARELGLSASTAHRYVRTWISLGLLDQDPVSRRYRRTDRLCRPSADV